MLKLSGFLLESEEKLKHLEHAEDHVINDGFEGFAHAFHNLEDVKDQLQGKKNKTKITTKYDGSPSVVFGHNPDNGQFFVASKSAFNKDPKLNYTFEDIEQNHGHSAGLVEKLKSALEHLPKVTPPSGVYQGDLMHSGGVKSEENPHGDVMEDKGKYHFKPNTITYSTPKGSAEGKKITNSKLGIAVHTSYSGNKFSDLKAEYGADLSHFKEHPDVHLIDTTDDIKHAKLTTNQAHTYQHHLNQAVDEYKQFDKKHYSVLEGHQQHLKTYINKTVRENTKPSVEGYREHLKNHHLKQIAGVKTAAAVERKTNVMDESLKHVDKHQEKFQSILNMHHHLQAAKDQLVHALSAKPKFEHTINGQSVKPEGYVVVRNNRPTKLVDRAEFSRANFLARPR
mgnify:CR=1 FL=1